MNKQQAATEAPEEGIADDEAAAAQANWDKVTDAIAPHLPQLVQGFVDRIAGHNERALTFSTILLGVLMLILGGLAAYAMNLGKMDTAEKIVIAMVSFLAGTLLVRKNEK